MGAQGITKTNSLKKAFKNLSGRISESKKVTQNKSWDNLPQTAIAQICTFLPSEALVSAKNVARSWKKEGQRTIQQAITDFAKVVNNNAISIAEMITRPKETQEKCKEFKELLGILRCLPTNKRTEISKDIRAEFNNQTRGEIDKFLQNVAKTKNSAYVPRALILGADINSANQYGDTALHKAAIDGHKKIVQALLKAGADINLPNDDRETALHVATTYKNTKIVEALLKFGADVNLPNNDGDTALHKAAIDGHKKIVQALLKAGANVNLPNDDRETALHVATTYENTKIVQALLKAGADVSLFNNYGTALDYAMRTGKTQVIKILENAAQPPQGSQPQ